MIVVVEDDPILRSDAVVTLQAEGFDVVDFETADVALTFIEKRNGEVVGVLTDIHMPGKLDGFDLAIKINMTWPDVTVLMTSGQERPSSLLLLSIAFLPKPWLVHRACHPVQHGSMRRWRNCSRALRLACLQWLVNGSAT